MLKQIADFIEDHEGSLMVEIMVEEAIENGENSDLKALKRVIERLSPNTVIEENNGNLLPEHNNQQTHSEEKEEPETDLRASEIIDPQNFNPLFLINKAIELIEKNNKEPENNARLTDNKIITTNLTDGLDLMSTGALGRGNIIRQEIEFRPRFLRNRNKLERLRREDDLDDTLITGPTPYVRVSAADLTTLYGPILFGTIADDALSGDGNPEFIYGGFGNDILQGHSARGADTTYLFDIGDGNDTVRDSGDNRDNDNTAIFLGRNFDINDLSAWNGVNSTFNFGDGDSVTFENLRQFTIDSYQFEDQTLTSAQLEAAYVANAATAGSETIYAGIHTTSTLTSGAGDDILVGNYYRGQSTTYVFEIGDGNDTVRDGGDNRSQTNTAIFNGRNFDINDLIAWNGVDATFDFGGGDSVTFENLRQFTIDSYQFDDQTLTSAQLEAAYLANAATAGSETIYAGIHTTSTLTSGAGDDILVGNYDRYQDTTYIFNIGDGNDTVRDGGDNRSQTNTAIFNGRNFDINDLIAWNGIDATFDFGGSDSVTFENLRQYTIDSYQFDDQTLTSAQLESAYVANAATAGSETIYAGIHTSSTLTSGAGDDILVGNHYRGESTTYVFEIGDGNDTIQDSGDNRSQTNTAIFNGRNFDANTISWDGTDLVFNFGGGDSVTIDNHATYRVHSFQFDDQTLTIDALIAAHLAASPTAGDDLLYGDDGNDILIAGLGMDTLTGGLGADNFVFEAATAFNGVDTVVDFNVGQGDTIDISDVLNGFYDPMADLLSDFVRFVDNGADSHLEIDQDGTAGGVNFVHLAIIENVNGLDAAALEAAGDLIV